MRRKIRFVTAGLIGLWEAPSVGFKNKSALTCFTLGRFLLLRMVYFSKAGSHGNG